MRIRIRSAALVALALAIWSCSDNGGLGPAVRPVPTGPSFDVASAAATALPEVRISEIHYDDVGADAGERVEISGPAGMDLTGWKVVPYNGANGQQYTPTVTLNGPVAEACGARGVVVVNIAGLQNGEPDGLALVDANNTVVEFLSYEGTFAATNGPAAGMTATDIGVSESDDATPDGRSLQRDGAGDFQGPIAETFGACNDHGSPPPPPPPAPETRIVEIHYDNGGANNGLDVGEAIEIEGPAGTILTNWKIVLYNGSNGLVYNTRTLSGTVPATCGARGVSVATYPTNGIQNGEPDGVALVDQSGEVVEFLSYESTFTAVDGPAAGLTSTDIRVRESGATPAGFSLQRTGAGIWQVHAPATFGACNDSKEPPKPPSSATVVISELMAAPHQAVGGASWGEWFEVHNYGTEPLDLQGWTILSQGQPSHTIASSVVVPAGGFAVLGRGDELALNGGVTIDYNYFSGGGAATIFLDATDVLELRDAVDALVDRVQWTNAKTMVRGVTRALRDASVENANVDGANWGYSTVTFGDGDFGTPDAANGTLANTPPPVPNTITFSGRTSSDPPLPVGFQDQLFATLVDGTGATLPPTSFTWSSVSNASIDANGVMTALAPGRAVVRATAADGTTKTYSLPTRVALASTTAQYAGNAEFGEPKDADASNDFIVRRTQYTASYNRAKGTPNWVSYNLEATHFGPEDRCDCFTFDPTLPASFTPYTTADYTGAGTFHGYGIDRGHLARSFDRTAGSLDNATTFYFTNIIPQAADNNQGPWAAMESYLGDFARLQNKEVYVIAGVAGSKGTVKNEGKITIPAHVWKVAVIMPRDQGLTNIDDYGDLEVVAAIMPNDPGIRDVNWETYRTTVDAVEALGGYNLLELLPDRVEVAVETGLQKALVSVDQLVASGNLDVGDGKWLHNKLELAVAHLVKDLRIPAVNQLEDVLKRLDALERSGKISAANAESLRAIVTRVIRSVSS
jgi:DNA/RNA endonuclease G (NUC1)